MTSEATFDENHHTITAGWATYQGAAKKRPPMWRFSLRCRAGHHVMPTAVPVPANGHSPSNSSRCPRCRAFVKWYVIGQHRFGSYDKDVFDAIAKERAHV